MSDVLAPCDADRSALGDTSLQMKDDGAKERLTSLFRDKNASLLVVL